MILIDAYSQIFRCYHAVRHLNNSRGEPTNALLPFTRLLLKLQHDFPGERGAMVFDCGRVHFRLELNADYKANRPPTPEDLKQQVPVLRELAAAFGWPLLEEPEYEADDLIASIAEAFPENEIQIFSGDKDISQIIDERVIMLAPNPSGDVLRRGVAEVREKFGVEPGQLADYLALVGDASDNIPGVEGVGPKTAAALLNQFGSAEQMFSHLDEVKRETLRTRLAGEKEHFQRNRKLVLLDRKPPEGTLWKLEDLRRTEPDFDAIRDIADRMSLKSIRKEIDKLAGESGKTEEEDASLFSFHEPREPEAGKNAGKETGTMTQMDLFG